MAILVISNLTSAGGKSLRTFLLLALCLGSGCAASAPARQVSVASSLRFYQQPIPLGEEYTDYEKSGAGSSGGSSGSVFRSVLLYLPNRIFDLFDVVRTDVGIGPSFGAVVRLTKWGQAGYRELSPLSLRVGLRGRQFPIFVERSNEFGIGPLFAQSHDRDVRPFEVGAGADLLLVGAYAGIAFDELLDFILGFGGIDISSDDSH